MKKLRADQLLLGLAILYFLGTGTYKAWHKSYDFVTVYSGTRCLLHGCNPYDTAALQQQYKLSGGSDPHFNSEGWEHSQPPVYPPSTFVAILPFGLLGLPAAQDLWIAVNALLFVIAVYFLVSSCSGPYLWMANLLAAFFLFSCRELLTWANPGCMAVSLLIFSCVFYWRKSRPVLAACLLCLSLALKPQIGGLIALYLLFDKSRRRSVSAAIVGAIALLLIGGVALQINPSSQHWLADLRANVNDSLLPGHVNDPKTLTGWEVNLEPAVAVVSSSTATTKIVTDGILVVLLGGLIYGIVKVSPSSKSSVLVFSGIAVFSMLAVYHRRTDTALLLLTIPSILFILERRKVFGIIVAVFTVLASAPIESVFYSWIMSQHGMSRQVILNHKILLLLLLRQENLALIVLFCLYIGAFYRLESRDSNKALVLPMELQESAIR